MKINVYKLFNKNPNKLVEIIHEALGNRLNYIKRNPDAYQEFWLAILEKISAKEIKSNNTQISYLISIGIGAIKNMRKSIYSRDYIKYCTVCGKSYGFRRVKPCVCGSISMNLYSRCKAFEDYMPSKSDDSGINFIYFEQFVNTLTGNIKYVAKRLLVERVDQIFTNYSKQLAYELDVSAPMISKYVKKIRQLFLIWSG